jgi:hypothetical protein
MLIAGAGVFSMVLMAPKERESAETLEAIHEPLL